MHGTADRPRLSVFRSKAHLTVQLIDDNAGQTLLAMNDQKLPKSKEKKSDKAGLPTAAKRLQAGPGIARAHALGKLLAEEAKKNGITRVVFDRGGYAYHGKIQAIADGARAGGLDF
jgi:large subunit ribosomal protein L18